MIFYGVNHRDNCLVLIDLCIESGEVTLIEWLRGNFEEDSMNKKREI